MISDKILPAHILRLYVWELLKKNNALALVNGYVPILPIEEEPKVSDANKAYIIYGYGENDSSNLDAIRMGVFSLRVASPTSNELGRIMNIISTAFSSQDIVTENVNLWSSTNPALVGIRFTSLATSFVEGGEPSETEAGPVEGLINITYRYVSNLETALPIKGGLWGPPL